MAAIITNQGAALIAKQQAKGEALVIKNFVFAYIDGLDTNQTPSDTETLPANDKINYSPVVTKAGYVNPAQVVYSVIVGSDVGDWPYNWLGLQADDGTLFAVAYIPTQQKVKNNPPQIGNTITRNFLISFDGAKSITQITIPAESWQFDITDKLDDMDQRSRLAIRGIFGRSTFFYDGFQVVKNGALSQLTAGDAYIEGIRLSNSTALTITPELGKAIYLDVFLQKQDNIKQPVFNVSYGDSFSDYTDSAGTVHYLIKIANNQHQDCRTKILNADSLVSAISNDPNGDPLDIASIAALQKLKEDLIVNTNELIGDAILTKAQRGIINASALNADTVLTLPPANVDNKGVEYTIRRTDNSDHMLQIKTSSNDKILFHLHLSNTGYGHFELIGQGDYWSIYNDGAGYWYVTGRYDSAPMGTPTPYMSLTLPSGGYFPAARSAFNTVRFPWLLDYANQSGIIINADKADLEENAGLWVIDSANNTVLSPDLRGEFIRSLDLGRGIDTDREIATAQGDAIRNITGSMTPSSERTSGAIAEGTFRLNKLSSIETVTSQFVYRPGTQFIFDASTVVPTANENRPRNIAYPFIFKAI